MISTDELSTHKQPNTLSQQAEKQSRRTVGLVEYAQKDDENFLITLD